MMIKRGKEKIFSLTAISVKCFLSDQIANTNAAPQMNEGLQ